MTTWRKKQKAVDIVGNDEDPDVVWQVIFDAKYALVVLSFLEHKVDDLVFLRYKCVMESDGDFETSPTSNHSDPKLKKVSKSQDSNTNDDAQKDSRADSLWQRSRWQMVFPCLVNRVQLVILMVISWVCHFAQIRR